MKTFTYLARRLVTSAVLIVAVSSASLLLTRLAPGDYTTEAIGITAHRETLAEARTRYGLDRPLLSQYMDWLARIVRLDFGRSLAYDRPVLELVPERASNTAALAAGALILATILGVPLGVISATTRAQAVRAAIRAASLVLVSVPPLLMSLILVFAAAQTGWLPIGGMQSLDSSTSGAAVDRLRHLIVPTLALALPIAAAFERLQSQATTQVIGQAFVRAATARGVPRSRIVWRDAFKASLKPIAAVYGIAIGTLLSGSFVVEMVTSWPGLGRLMLDALRARDVYLVAGCAAAGSLFLAAGTLMSDAVLAFVDPRSLD